MTISIILAFHAHEPSWRLPPKILASLRDGDLRREDVGNDDWVERRARQGRDVYARLLDFGSRLGAPVCLEATNELLMQLRLHVPATFDRLRDAYAAGDVYPIYGNAFHTHIAMIGDDELADELRLNAGYVHDVLGAPRPRHPGAFPMEGSIDARRLEGFARAGMEYVVFPQLSPLLARYRFEHGEPNIDAAGDFASPFVIGDGLLALPRNFCISQEIWRPITRWMPDALKPQGYILGKYPVLDEEYRTGRTVAFPIDREQAIAEYAQTLCDALRDARDGALLLYIQDLELMDFGEQALEILGEAWTRVRDEGADITFVTPDTYIDSIADREKLPRLRFHQASWAPEIRLVLRSDGQYPPRHAGPYRGVDADTEIFRRWPFIFWEPGRFIAGVCKHLLHAFGHPLDLPLTAAELESLLYPPHDRPDGSQPPPAVDAPATTVIAAANPPDGAQPSPAVISTPDAPDVAQPSPAVSALATTDPWLAINMRAMQRACNTGWQPDEARHKWLYMHAIAILEHLRQPARADGPDVATNFTPFAERDLRGLDRVLEIFVDTRVAYLRAGIARLGDRAGDVGKRGDAESHLQDAERRRKRASALARQLLAENIKFVAESAIDGRGIQRMLALLQEHCKEAWLALNEVQRAWMSIDSTDAMIEEMYGWLDALYPPLMPAILRDLATPEEIAALDDPPLT